MTTPFPLANGMVIQVTITGRSLDQMVVNRFDVVIANISTAVSSGVLLTNLESVWAANISGLLSNAFIHRQTKVQEVTDVIPTTDGYKRVYGAMQRGDPNVALNGGGGNPLPYDATVSCQLITNGPPRKYWGRKSFGPPDVGTVQADGESLDPTVAASWLTNAGFVFTGPHTITATTATWECVVIPAAEIAAIPLPHAALNTYVKDIIGVDVGTFIGSQSTRRINPNSLLGH